MTVPHGFLEVIDSILLFCNSHKNESSDISLWISLTLNDTVVVATEVSTPNTGFLLLDFQVRVGGLGSYYTNGISFLQNLIESYKHVHKLLLSSEDSLIRVFCRRIGDYDNVSIFERKFPSQADIPVTESVLPRQFDFKSLTLHIKRVRYDSNIVASTFSFLHKHIILSQLINPQMTIHLCTNLSVPGDTSIALTPLSWIRIVSTHFKIASTLDAHIGTNSLSKWKKIKLLRGCPALLSNVEMFDRFTMSIKLLSCVGVLPYFRLTKGKKIPADRICNKIQISFYGPGNIVVFPIGSEPCFDIRDLINWSDYRITIGDRTDLTEKIDPPFCTSSFEYKLSSIRENDKMKKRILKIFVFIEEDMTEEQRLLYKRSPHQRWTHHTELTLALRNNFNRFLITERKKFRKVLHSSLNKLICNYGSFEKVNSTVSSAIPILSDAVSNIIRNSSNKHFQQSCLNTLSSNSLEEIDMSIESKLKCLANKKLSVGDRGSDWKCPQEPTTPELEEAINNNIINIPTSVSRQRPLLIMEPPPCNDHSINDQRVPAIRNGPDNEQQSCSYNLNHNIIATDNVSSVDHFESLLDYDHQVDNNDIVTNNNTTQLTESWNNFEHFENFENFNSIQTSPYQSFYTESNDNECSPMGRKEVNGTMSLQQHYDISEEHPIDNNGSCDFDQLGDLEFTEDNYQFIPEQLNGMMSSNAVYSTGEYCYNDEDFNWD